MIKPEDFTDVLYDVGTTLAVLTINRPERLNAFRGRTVDELITAFKTAWSSTDVAAVMLTGAGDKAFCAGGDVKERAETGGYGETEWGTFEIERLHRIIRDIPKPVIAAVNGVAVGGGHVLHVLCDLTVAASTPGSVRAARGSGRSTPASAPPTWPGWSARSAHGRSGSCSTSTTPRPPSGGAWSTRSSRPTSCSTAVRGYARIGSFSPTALRFLKHSFNADTDHIGGLSHLAFDGLELFAAGRGHGGGRGLRREAPAGLLAVPPRPDHGRSLVEARAAKPVRTQPTDRVVGLAGALRRRIEREMKIAAAMTCARTQPEPGSIHGERADLERRLVQPRCRVHRQQRDAADSWSAAR